MIERPRGRLDVEDNLAGIAGHFTPGIEDLGPELPPDKEQADYPIPITQPLPELPAQPAVIVPGISLVNQDVFVVGPEHDLGLIPEEPEIPWDVFGRGTIANQPERFAEMRLHGEHAVIVVLSEVAEDPSPRHAELAGSVGRLTQGQDLRAGEAVEPRQIFVGPLQRITGGKRRQRRVQLGDQRWVTAGIVRPGRRLDAADRGAVPQNPRTCQPTVGVGILDPPAEPPFVLPAIGGDPSTLRVPVKVRVPRLAVRSAEELPHTAALPVVRVGLGRGQSVGKLAVLLDLAPF